MRRIRRLAYAILDGTLIPIDRVADQKPYGLNAVIIVVGFVEVVITPGAWSGWTTALTAGGGGFTAWPCPPTRRSNGLRVRSPAVRTTGRSGEPSADQRAHRDISNVPVVVLAIGRLSDRSRVSFRSVRDAGMYPLCSGVGLVFLALGQFASDAESLSFALTLGAIVLAMVYMRSAFLRYRPRRPDSRR